MGEEERAHVRLILTDAMTRQMHALHKTILRRVGNEDETSRGDTVNASPRYTGAVTSWQKSKQGATTRVTRCQQRGSDVHMPTLPSTCGARFGGAENEKYQQY